MPDVARIELQQWSLEIPLSDFEHLPQELGCSIHRRGSQITLAPDRPGCEATFVVRENVAVLETVTITTDPGGRFLRDVIGLLFQVYSGDLVAQVTWSGGGQEETRLVFRDGETTHPFLLEAVTEEFASDALQSALDEAEAAWGEYQRLKRRSPSESLT